MSEVGAVLEQKVKGVVKFYNGPKGFGFLSRDGAGDVFVHATALKRSGIAELREGDSLEFDVIASGPGKGPKADNLRRLVLGK